MCCTRNRPTSSIGLILKTILCLHFRFKDSACLHARGTKAVVKCIKPQKRPMFSLHIFHLLAENLDFLRQSPSVSRPEKQLDLMEWTSAALGEIQGGRKATTGSGGFQGLQCGSGPKIYHVNWQPCEGVGHHRRDQVPGIQGGGRQLCPE